MDNKHILSGCLSRLVLYLATILSNFRLFMALVWLDFSMLKLLIVFLAENDKTVVLLWIVSQPQTCYLLAIEYFMQSLETT